MQNGTVSLKEWHAVSAAFLKNYKINKDEN